MCSEVRLYGLDVGVVGRRLVLRSMWYCRVAGRNVGLATATAIALVLVDMMNIVNLIAAVELIVAGRTKAARLGVAAG